MSYDIIGAVGVGIVGQTPPGPVNGLTSNYVFRYVPAKGANDSLVYDLSGKNRNATINGSIVVNGRTITSTLTPATAWASTALTLGSTTGAIPVIDPSFLNNYRPDQGDSLLLFAKMYVPTIPATGGTVTVFGAMGRNSSSQNNGIRFVVTCKDHANPKTIQIVTYDAVGGSKFTGNSLAQLVEGADNYLGWYIDPTNARAKMFVNGASNWASANSVYMRNFYTDILTSTTAQTPAFGIGSGEFNLSVALPSTVIKQVDLVIVKGRGIANPDAAFSKLQNFPGVYLTDGDVA